MESIDQLIALAAASTVPAEERLAAYGEVVRRFQDMAYGCAYSIIGDFHLAEDAAQEAFVQAYRQLPVLREPKAFPGWLRRIVVTQCNRMTRRQQVETVDMSAAVGKPAPGALPPEVAEHAEMKQRVLTALWALPENQRITTALYYINGYSTKEIAQFLDVPVTTVKKRLADAREQLKERMLAMVDHAMKSRPLPGDFADLVVRRAASPDDLQRAAGWLGYNARKRPADFQSPTEATKAGLYVVGQPGEAEGAGYFDEMQFSIGSTILRAARPREVGEEGEGAPSPVFVKSMRGALKLASQDGMCLAVVHASMFDHAFCGFVPCFYYPLASLPCERARGIVTRAVMSPTTADEEGAARKAWLLDPYSPRLSAFIGGGETQVIRVDGQTAGYVRVNRAFDSRKQYGMNFGYIADVTVSSREAALAVIRVGAEAASAAGESNFCVMQSHMALLTQSMLSLGGTYVLRGSCDQQGLDAEMVAIIDLLGLSRQLTNEFQSRFVASRARDVDAAMSIEMAGETVGFRARAGRLEIVSERQTVHQIIPRWVATRLYVGYYSGQDVLAMGPIPWDRSNGQMPDDPALDNLVIRLPPAEAGLFAALFPKLWPCSWPDPDVWPWVIGQSHPRYQNEQRKTPEVKAQIDALRLPWIGR